MEFQDIATTPSKLLAMTGHTLDEFNALLPWFEEGLSESRHTLEGKERKHQVSNYKNSALPSTKEKLLFILTYYKQYLTQTALGVMFDLSQPQANRWIHFLNPALQAALSKAGVAPCRDMKVFSDQESGLFAHDGTERPIQRPKDNEKQKEYYSGKQKMHTVKNNLLGNSNCEVVFLTPTVEGKKHDKKLADESEYVLPKGSQLLQDTGFQGFTIENVLIMQPKKKPKGKELTQDEKDSNREISRIRVRIEHIINGVKRCRIIKDKCRNWLKGFKDRIMEVACGLHNFRLKFRPWKTMEL